MQTKAKQTVATNHPDDQPADQRPVLPGWQQAPDADTRARWWCFHLGQPLAEPPTPPGDQWLPALLHPFRHPEAIRYDYPLFLNAPTPEAAEQPALTLADLLRQLTDQIAPGPDDARPLKDNLARLERLVRDQLADQPTPQPAAPILAEAARLMREQLALTGDAAAELAKDLEQLLQRVPTAGHLLALSEAAAIQLFIHAATGQMSTRATQLRQRIEHALHAVRDLICIEQARSGEAAAPDALGESVGQTGAEHVDPQALARVLESSRHAPPPDAKRRDRLEHARQVLESFLAADPPPPVTIVHDPGLPETWKGDAAHWNQVTAGQVCQAATAVFDAQAAHYAELFAVMRIVRLESEGTYDSARHDRLLTAFDWQSFTPDELASMPKVLAIESAEHLAGSGMADLSGLLLSGRPVAVLVAVQPARNPADTKSGELSGYHFELAYLGISHREALVHQSSASRPQHLLTGFRAALGAAHASLHVVASGLLADGSAPPLGAWLHIGAALEGRAHPFLLYNPEAGQTWARRLDLEDNPALEVDWPAQTLECRTPDGQSTTRELAFTFADFCLLEPTLREHFMLLDGAGEADELVDLATYLGLPADQPRQRLPVIWAVNAEGQMAPLLVSHALTVACRDRLDFWRTLQELGGIRNEHVREALERQRQRLQNEFDQQRETLLAKHAAEVERVRNEAAGEAMQRLAQALLDTDIESLGSPATRAPAARASAPATSAPQSPPAEAADAPAAEPAAVQEEEEELLAQEPWITSALCTSCNDCINLNPQMFVYNANKQATIGDPRAGTYAQLVQAAEKCPARCIHPGLPLNPDEPNLEELIERAKPFN